MQALTEKLLPMAEVVTPNIPEAEILSGMKNINILEQIVTVKSALKDEQDAQLEALADAIVASLQ